MIRHRRRIDPQTLASFLVVGLALAAVVTGALTLRPWRIGGDHLPLPAAAPQARIRWPAAGASAAWTRARGALMGPAAEREVAIASVAKVMTAYVVLRDHPLAPGDPGPAITVSFADAAAYSAERARGESLVPVDPGETLTEREALQALLLPSADNLAWILARWDAGSVGAFLARMNATARELGMTRTRYTDPSGLDPSTRSTAADQVRLGRAALRLPALAEIVDERTAEIPVAGRIANLDTLLGTDGIRGIKTGSTSAAGGCVLLAAGRGSHEVIAAVLGEPGSATEMLPRALAAGRSLTGQLTALAAVSSRAASR